MAAEQSTSITIGANSQPYVDALKQAQTATNNFNVSLDQLTVANKKSTSEVTTTAQSFAKLASSLDPAVRSAEQFAAAELKINAAVAAGLSTRDQANKLLDLANEKYKTLAYQTQQTAKAQADAQRTQVAQAQQSYNQLQASINPVVRQQQEQAKVQGDLNTLMTAGRISAIASVGTMAQWQKAQKAAGDEGKALTGATKLTSQQLFVFEAQVRQFADQVMSGGGIFRPLAMQAPVAVESLGGVSNALALLRRNMGLIAGVGGVVAIVGTLVALGVAAEHNQRSINALSNGLQKFGGDFKTNAAVINDAARTMAETTSLGTQEARDAMAELASAPGFKTTKENLIATTKAVQDMAAGMGVSTQEAAKFVTTIFADPVAAAMDGVNKHVDGFTNNFVSSIKDMVNQGRQADAINAVFNKWSVSMKGAGDNVTPLQKALHDLNEAFTGLGNSAGSAGKNLGTGLTNALAGVINDVTSCVKFLGQMSAAFEKMGVSGKTQIELVGGLLTLQLLPGVRNVEAALVKMAAVQFGSLVSGLYGVATAANAVGASLMRNPAIMALVAAMTAYQLVSGQQKELVDEEKVGAQLGIHKAPGGPFGLTPTYTDETGKPISHDEALTRIGGFVQAPTMQFPANVSPAATNLVSTAQSFEGQTGAALNQWLNANGAQIDAAKSAWCAAFVNSALASVGIAGTGSNLASSFLNFSEERKGPAQKGDIIVQPPQAQGTSGHVGVFTGNLKVTPDGKTYLEMTSGNEGGKVQTNFVSQSNISSIRALPAATSNVGPANDPAAAKKALDEQRLLNMPNSMAVQRQQLEDQKKASLDLIATGTLTGDALDKEQQKVRDLDAALYKLVDPMTQITRGQKDQLAVSNELNPAQQKLIEIGQQYDEMMRARGEQPDPAQRLQLQKQALDELAAGYRQITSAGEVQAASEERLAAAWEQGAAAAQHQANAEKAQQAIAGNSPTITLQQSAAIDKYTESLDRNTAAQQKQQLAQMKLQDDATNHLLDAQEATAASSVKTQAQAEAAAQAANQLDAMGVTDPAKRQAAIDRANKTAARTVDVDREKQAWAEVNNAASAAIDDMGDGLNSFLSTGKWSDFAAAGKKALADISAEFIKMALLNPLKNLLTGSNTSTLFDLFKTGGSAAGGLLGGGGAATAGVADVAWDLPLLHEGGIVGVPGGNYRTLPSSYFQYAPHFASGGLVSAMGTLPLLSHDEVPAVLHRGERVLTRQQQRDAAAQAGRSNRPVYIQPTFNISTPDADSFRKSKNQISAELIRSMTSATRKI